jgi:hypothetical protein
MHAYLVYLRSKYQTKNFSTFSLFSPKKIVLELIKESKTLSAPVRGHVGLLVKVDDLTQPHFSDKLKLIKALLNNKAGNIKQIIFELFHFFFTIILIKG